MAPDDPCTGRECRIVTQQARNPHIWRANGPGCTIEEYEKLRAIALKRIVRAATSNSDTCTGDCVCVALKDADPDETDWETVPVSPFSVRHDDCVYSVTEAQVEIQITSTPGLCRKETIEVSSAALLKDGIEVSAPDAETLARVDTAKLEKAIKPPA